MSGGEYDENAAIQRNTQSNYFGAIIIMLCVILCLKSAVGENDLRSSSGMKNFQPD